MKRTKLLALMLAGILMFPLIGYGCGGSEGVDDVTGEVIDYNRTQIRIDHYNGGVGSAWYKPLKERFENAYKDYKVGDKTGVQLIISNNKDSGTAKVNSIEGSTSDVFMGENYDYYDCVSKGLFYDITDVVTDVNTDGKTIESKLNDEQKNYYKYNGKYFALPHYVIYYGLVYNMDLFENKKLYFAQDPDLNDGFIAKISDKKTAGPNGEYGDYDDGLPATYEEFYKLLDKMVDSGVTPFTWSGEYGKAYFTGFLARLMATYEGKEQTMLNFTFNGTANNLVESINPDGTVNYKAPTAISESDGYKIYQSAGRYYAFKMAEKIGSNKNYYDSIKTNNESDSHTDAQTRYILSCYDKAKTPIAFLVEGSYWENEAYDVGAFSALKNTAGMDRQDVRFGYMPMPRVSDAHAGNKEVMMDSSFSLAFINANVATRCPEKIDLLKEFLKFVYTDESLSEYTAKTNSFKGLNYEMRETDKNELSSFVKSLMELKDDSDIVYPFDNNNTFIKNRSSLTINQTFRNEESEWATVGLIKNKVSATSYFNSLKDYRQKNWNN